MRSAVVSFFVFCFALSAGPAMAATQNGAASIEALRVEVMQVIAEARPDLKPAAGVEPWQVETAAGTLSLFNLARMVEGRQGEDRRAEILRFVTRAVEPSTPNSNAAFAAIAARLRIQIAPAEYGAPSSPIRALHRPFAEGVVVAYVIDHDDHIEYVRDDRPAEWKVDRGTVERTAVANLERSVMRSPITVEKAKVGVGRHVIVLDGDGYGAARILCPGYMARLHEELGPHLFIGIPARDVLIVWTPGHGARTRLVDLVGDIYRTRSHPLTQTVFVTDGGRLRPASPAELAD